jgi:hypothetical protein
MPKLKELDVSFVSLVKNPANKKDIVFKAADKYNITKMVKVVKTDPKGLIYGTVYEADTKDSQGDWADIDTIRKAAHEFLMKGKNLNVDEDHNEKPSGAAIVESYVDDKAWKVTIKADPESETFKKVLKGDYEGLSLMGIAKKVEEEPPAKEDALAKSMEEIKQLKEQVAQLQKSMESLPGTKQIEFDKDGNIIAKKSDDTELFSEFKTLEV